MKTTGKLATKHLSAVKDHHRRLARTIGPDFWGAGGGLQTMKELRRLNARLEVVASAISKLQLSVARSIDCRERGV